MRRRVCARCGKLLPLHTRSDAIYCPGNRCKQAAWRAEKLSEEANKAFKARVEIAVNAHADRDLLEFYRNFLPPMPRTGSAAPQNDLDRELRDRLMRGGCSTGKSAGFAPRNILSA